MSFGKSVLTCLTNDEIANTEDAVKGQLLGSAPTEDKPVLNFSDSIYGSLSHQMHSRYQGRNAKTLDYNVCEHYLHGRLSVIFNLGVSTTLDGLAGDF